MATALHWFRRDLRVRDNTALYTACADHDAAAGVFVIDPRWFGDAEKMGPHQAKFWLESLRELRQTLEARNVPLAVRINRDPVAAVLSTACEIGADTITYNKEYEPDQVTQDDRLEREGAATGIKVLAYKDAAIFEEQEILTNAGGVYSVFTPYKKAYLKRLVAEPPELRGLPRKMPRPVTLDAGRIPTPADLRYAAVPLDVAPGEAAAHRRLAAFVADGLGSYAKTRDVPALSITGQGTSRLSAHLNAGTVSIRQVFHAAVEGKWDHAADSVFAGELIWREFYRMILYNFPHTVSKPFNDGYGHVTWASNHAHFAAWAEGRTGYPVVDAAMKQLAATGFMHNRLRMVAAMFLAKDLDCHWVLGERFFMKSLVDYDQASNVGGWQWSASTGTDAAPYFRVMNPTLQGERYDPNGAFVRHYLPALREVPAKFVHAPWTMPAEVQRTSGCVIGRDYPAPIVDHAAAKAKAVAKFRKT